MKSDYKEAEGGESSLRRAFNNKSCDFQFQPYTAFKHEMYLLLYFATSELYRAPHYH